MTCSSSRPGRGAYRAFYAFIRRCVVRGYRDFIGWWGMAAGLLLALALLTRF